MRSAAMHRLLAPTVLPFAALLAACDPGTHVHAHVTTAGVGGETARPVEGATVTLRCHDDARPLGTTDADGRFAYDKLGSMHVDCNLEVTREGYEPLRYRVGDVCAKGTVAGHCPLVELQPVMKRVAVPDGG